MTQKPLEFIKWTYAGQKVYIVGRRGDGLFWVPAIVDQAFGDAAYVTVIGENESRLIDLDSMRKIKDDPNEEN